MNTQAHIHIDRATTATRGRRTTNGGMEVLEAIRDTIGALVRSGGLDSPACEGIARRTLRELHRLTERQAATLWEQFARG